MALRSDVSVDPFASERAYLDYASFAPVDPRVLAVMLPFLEAGVGDPSAPHSLGAEARVALEAARVKVARLCGGAPAGVVFTSGATEANNLAVRGAVLASDEAPAPRIVASAVAHASVLETCRELERCGGRLDVLPVDGDGRVELPALREALRSGPSLVTVTAASGETGTVEPIAAIAGLTRAAGVPLHVDAVGAIGRIPLTAGAMGIDLLTLSGNDLYGPPGTGALWVRPGLALRAQTRGAGEENGRRAGRENVPGVVGLGVAADIMRNEAASEAARLVALRDRLIAGLLTAVADCRLLGARADRLPHHVSVVVRGVKADAVLADLDLDGISASSGSGCARATRTASGALHAIGCGADEVEGSLCFTLGRWSTDEDVDRVLGRLPAIVERRRAVAAVGRG